MPLDLTDGDGGPVAEQDAAGFEPVRAEIHETAHGALGADFFGDDDLVQAVLGRQHRAVFRQMRFQGAHRLAGMVRLYGEDDAPEFSCHICRKAGADILGEGLDRSFDDEAVAVHRIDMRLDDVDEEDVLAGASEIGAQRAADGARAPDQNGVLVHVGISHYQFSMSARVSSRATDQMAFMSASGRW